MTKTCYQCKTTKPVQRFYRSVMTTDGRLGMCVECKLEISRAWRAKNRAHIRRRDVAYYASSTQRRLDVAAASAKYKASKRRQANGI